MGKLKPVLLLAALAACAPANPPASLSLAPHVPFAVAGGPPVRLSVVVRDAEGTPMALPVPRIEASAGQVGQPVEHRGFFNCYYVPPAEPPAAPVRLTATVEAGGVRRTAELLLPVRPPVSLEHEDGTVRVRAQGRALRLSANVGTVSPLRPGPDGWTADFTPPAESGPRRVILELRDADLLLKSLTFPISSKRNVTLRSEPGAVLDARLGDTPVFRTEVGAEGTVTFPVEVTPENSLHDLAVTVTDPAGNPTRNVIDLEADHGDVFSLSVTPPALPAGGNGHARVTVRLRDKSGRPRPGARLSVTADRGRTGPVRDNLDGTYTLAFHAPPAPGTASLTATTVLGGRMLEVRADVPITPGPASTLSVRPAQDRVTADGMTSVRLTLAVADASGTPLPDEELEVQAPFGRLTPPMPLGNGVYASDYTPPLQAKARTVTLTAGVRESSPGEAADLELIELPGRRAVAARVRDNRGRPVRDAVVRFHVAGAPDGEMLTNPHGLATRDLPAGDLLLVRATLGTLADGLVFGLPPLHDEEQRRAVSQPSGDSIAARARVNLELLPVEVVASNVKLLADPDRLPGDGKATAALTATVQTADGRPVGGKQVEMETGLGKIGPVTDLGDGTYTATYTAPSAGGTATVTARNVTDGALSPSIAIQIIPLEADRITLVARPVRPVADPNVPFEVVATVLSADGQPVPDGTEVTFGFDGRTATATTLGGEATAEFPAPARAGLHPATARSGPARGTLDIPFLPGPPAALALRATPARMAADPGLEFVLDAAVQDGQGNPVADGTEVVFSFNTIVKRADTVGGAATATYPALATPGAFPAAAAAGSASGAATLTFTGSSGIVLEISADDDTVPVTATTLLTVTARDALGNPVPDGTEIRFTAVLGTVPATATSQGGTARVLYRAGTSTGAGSVTALLGPASAVAPLTVVAGRPNTIELVALPDTLPADGISTANVQAVVRDAFGNLVPGERIDFTVEPAGGLERVVPAFALTNGQGEADVTYTAGLSTGSFLVRARSRSRTEIQAVVQIDQLPITSRVIVVSGVEPAPGDGNSVTLTVEIRDQGGALDPDHPDYTATVAVTGSATTASTVSIPSGSTSTTITLDDAVAEIVTVSLVETSSTDLVEVAGLATFIPGTPAQVRVGSAVEGAPGTLNSVTLPVEILDADGNLQPIHPTFTANVTDDSATAVALPASLTIPSGAATASILVDSGAVEVVNVTLVETTATGIPVTPGTATFIAGPPDRAVVVSTSGVVPGPLTVTIRIEDASGTPVTAHPDYTATVAASSGTATVTGSPILIPNGSASTTVTVTEPVAGTVTLSLTETSATGLAEVDGTATFAAGPAAEVVVVDTAGMIPGPVTVTIEVRDASGNPQPSHAFYTANINDSSATATVTPASITIPDGVSSVTVDVTETAPGTVTLTPVETSATGLTEVPGDVLFQQGPATQVVVVDTSGPVPGPVSVTIEVRDAAGLPQSSHPAYTATVTDSSATATVAPASITIPDGVSSVTVDVSNTATEVVTLSLVETSATALTEVDGDVTFTSGVATQVVVVDTAGTVPGPVTVTIEVRDAGGVPVTSHPAYTANVTDSSSTAGVAPASITIPDGVSSVTVDVTDAVAEVVTLTLVETSATGLAEVPGDVTFQPGPATQVVVVDTAGPVPGPVTVTIEVRDANGNPQTSHPAYTANVTDSSATATVTPTSITIPDGVSSVTVDVSDTVAETVTLSLVETSATSLTEVNGDVTFTSGAATQVVVVDTAGTVPGPVTVTIEVRDAGGVPVTSHPAYTANVTDSSSTASVAPASISIPDGVSSVTVDVTDAVAEVVTLTLVETSATGLTEVDGNVTLQPGPATQVVVVDTGGAVPGPVTVTIEVRDANGNPQTSHPAYTANVTDSSSTAGVAPASITIPDGVSSVTVDVTDTVAEVVTLTLVETSATGLTEVDGNVTFQPGPATQVVVIGTTGTVPGPVTVTIEVRDAQGNPQTTHAAYTANITDNSPTATVSPTSISIPDGVSSVTVDVSNTAAETVTLTPVETSATGLTGVPGSVVFTPGPAAEVAVLGGSGSTSAPVTVTIVVRDAQGNPQSTHPDYSANVTLSSPTASVVPTSITIPDGTASVTVDVSNTAIEAVTVGLAETSATTLAEVSGTVTFTAAKADRVVVLNATEAPPGTDNFVTVTIQVQDSGGNPISAHAAYTATVTENSPTAGVTGSPISIPSGVDSTTITVSSKAEEIVTLRLQETSATGLAEISGTASFIAGPAFQVVVRNAVEPAPGSADSVAVTLEVWDAFGNPTPTPQAYTANLQHGSGTASILGSPATIPAGDTSTTFTVTNADIREDVLVEPVETSATGLAEVSGTVSFIPSRSEGATEVVVVSAVEPAPGDGNSVTLTIEIRDGLGLPVTSHFDYAADLIVSGFAQVVGGEIGAVSIPDGTSSTTVTLTNTRAEKVDVELVETSGTNLEEVHGTASFIPGPALFVRPLDATEPVPGTSNSLTAVIQIRDANGNATTIGTDYTATLNVAAPASPTSQVIVIPAGSTSTTATVSGNSTAFSRTASLTETSATSLTEQTGTYFFTSPGQTAVRAVVLSGTESPPGNSNQITLVVQIQDAGGNPTTPPSTYTAELILTGHATTNQSVTIDTLNTQVNVKVDNDFEEVVTVGLLETSSTGLAEVSGTATFIAGNPQRLVVVSTSEPAPGTSDLATVTIEVQDAFGNPQPSHGGIGFTLADDSPTASISPSALSIPNGSPSATVLVNNADVGEIVTITPTQTSGTGRTMVPGRVHFLGDGLIAEVVSGSEPLPGDGDIATLTVRIRDSQGNPVTNHVDYVADAYVDGRASIVGGSAGAVVIPDGSSSTTIQVRSTFVETVNVTLRETSGSPYAEQAGTATFIAGPAVNALVLDAVEPNPGTVNSITVTIQIQDASGNPVNPPARYDADLAIATPGLPATQMIRIEPFQTSTTAVVTKSGGTAAALALTLTEISATTLNEVGGTAYFISGGGQGEQVVVSTGIEPAPGTVNQVILTAEIQQSNGNPTTYDVDYVADVFIDARATGPVSITIPAGTSSVSIPIDDTFEETVNVRLVETSGTNLAEVDGSATFIAGPATIARILDATESEPGDSNVITVTVQIEDDFGNPQPVHPAYTAGITESSPTASVLGSPVSIPDGQATATFQVQNSGIDETVALTLVEASATSITEVGGQARFVVGSSTATVFDGVQVVVRDAAEPPPGTSNQVVMTVEVQDSTGTPTTLHPTYTATVVLTGSASTTDLVEIPGGTASVTITIDDPLAEAVTVGLNETSVTGLAEVPGTATFIGGTAAQVVVGSVVEPAPGTADTVTMTIEVQDADGNPQASHPAYAATIDLGGSSAVATPSSITIPDGTVSVIITVDDAVAEVVNVTLLETSGTSLTEVNGTATFIDDPPVAIIHADADRILAGGAIDFDGSDSYALVPWTVTTWEWDFNGDGAVDSTVPDPMPTTYAAPGIYTVSLRVVDTGGYTDTAAMTVYVGNPGDPVGPILLSPDTNDLPADGTSVARFTSNVLTDATGAVVPDGTRVTVTSDMGTLLVADAGPEPGLQVATLGGAIAFDLRAGRFEGIAHVEARSVSGTSSGSAEVTLHGDTVPPFVVEATPAGFTADPPSSIRVTFSEDLLSGSVSPANFTVTGSVSGPIAGALSYVPSERAIVFAPDVPLDVANEVFTVTASNGIRDRAYNGLDGNANGVDEGGADDHVFQFGAVGDTQAPVVRSASAAPDPFSPDGDGIEDATLFQVDVTDDVGVARWQVRLVSGGATIRVIPVSAGTTAPWDGRDQGGVVVDEGVYDYEIVAWDGAGNRSDPATGFVEVVSPIQVVRYGP